MADRQAGHPAQRTGVRRSAGELGRNYHRRQAQRDHVNNIVYRDDGDVYQRFRALNAMALLDKPTGVVRFLNEVERPSCLRRSTDSVESDQCIAFPSFSEPEVIGKRQVQALVLFAHKMHFQHPGTFTHLFEIKDLGRRRCVLLESWNIPTHGLYLTLSVFLPSMISRVVQS